MTNSTNGESNNADEVALSQINDYISLIYSANNLVNFTFDADPAEEIAAVNPLLSNEEIVSAVLNERIADDDVVDNGNEDASMTVSSEPVTLILWFTSSIIFYPFIFAYWIITEQYDTEKFQVDPVKKLRIKPPVNKTAAAPAAAADEDEDDMDLFGSEELC
ncbi:hypothetical protein BDB00DRAFT_866801 [Zychaea mexicana]|uniref:uncharacterized protein n=1 Tax=Zychaea mexicana TaxID=64656 RepID=UPI0022FE523F|nr:uncharacterized protein BDB00DRAFT_866801 [Zychaea mexicana]KAI9499315.1 hypothetical protein BDB00DRAFT_866801 [Zychaea mexicana]